MRAISAFLLLLSLAPFVVAQTYTTDQVLAKMDANSKAFKSLEATIERAVTNNLLKKTENSKGKLYIESKGTSPRLKMEITEPKKSAQTALVDKGRASIYDHTPNTLSEHDLSNTKDDLLQLLMMGFGVSSDKLKKSYNISVAGQETIDGQPTTVLNLTALQASSRFPKIRMWISQKDWNAVQLEMTEQTRDTQLVKYKGVKLNKSISSSVFKLDLPKNVIRAK